MVRLAAGAEDLLHSRFALSPAFELNSLLRRLAGGIPTGWSPQLTDRLRPRFERLRRETALDAILALKAPRSGADFIAPPPGSADQTFEDDLATVRATPDAEARKEIDYYLRGCRDERIRVILTAPDALTRLADALEAAWAELLADDWPRVRAVCERDVVHRTGQLSRAGWSAALAGLAPVVAWRDGGLELPSISGDHVTLDGTGVLFIPSVFIWPDAAAHMDPGRPKTVIYPARGAATCFEPAESPIPEALAALLGRSRARLLLALGEPATTTQLGYGLDLPLGTVGDHLTVLRRARLVRRVRVGRSVRYERTALGDNLTAPAD